MKTFDPLGCKWYVVMDYRYQREGAIPADCNCGSPPEAYHAETCSVTPIYARTVRQLDSPRAITSDLTLDMTFQFGTIDTRINESDTCWLTPKVVRHA